MIVDLGCGDSKRGDIGIDRVPLPGVDLVVNLGFEPFPFEDNTIDKFTAYDFFGALARERVVPQQRGVAVSPSAHLSVARDLSLPETRGRVLQPDAREAQCLGTGSDARSAPMGLGHVALLHRRLWTWTARGWVWH